jgi:hypothetical protein
MLTDPEPGHVLPLFKDDYSVIFESDLEGELCVARITGLFVENAALPEMSCHTTFSQLGTHQIRATGVDPFGATATTNTDLVVTNGSPAVDIIRPAAGSSFNTNESIRFEAHASDPDETIFSNNIEWALGTVSFGTGSLVEATLSAGSHVVSVRVVDEFGETADDTITVEVVEGASFPFVEILAPEDGVFTSPNAVISFQAAAEDGEDGALSGASIRWTSDRDGELGVGTTLVATLSGPARPCNPESIVHEVTATATDSDGNSSSDAIRVHVGSIC